jgi:hypothetical protein
VGLVAERRPGAAADPKADFWTDSSAVVVIRLGLILVRVAGTFIWTDLGAAYGWS